MTVVTKADPRYLVVFGACLTQFTVIGLVFAYGLLFKTFEAEFGWSRTVLSGCASLAFLMMGVLAIFGGRLSDRFGPRIVLCFSGTLFGVGYTTISLISEPWHLYVIFGLFVGLGMSTHDVVTLSAVSRWFDRRRGMMTGVVKVGTALGQIAIPPFAAILIAGLGWRPAVVTLGILAAALLLLAACLTKNPPPTAETMPKAQLNSFEPKAVFKTRLFWSLCAIQFLFLPTLTTVPLHVVVHGMDLGMTAGLAATLLSVSGAASIIGRLAIGSSTDRIGGRNALILCFLPLIVSLAALLIADGTWSLFPIVAVYGFAHGGFFTIIAPTIAEYFGTRAHGTIFGAMLFFGAIGGALGPILAGRVFDSTGSYTLAFASLTVMATLGLALAVSLPRKANIA